MAELRLPDELRVDGSKWITHQSNRSVHSWPEGSSSFASVVLKNLQLPHWKIYNYHIEKSTTAIFENLQIPY